MFLVDRVQVFDFRNEILESQSDLGHHIVLVHVCHEGVQVLIRRPRPRGLFEVSREGGLQVRFKRLQDLLPPLHVPVEPHRLVLVERNEIIVVFVEAFELDHANKHLDGLVAALVEKTDHLQPVLSVDHGILSLVLRYEDGAREGIIAVRFHVVELVLLQFRQMRCVEVTLDFSPMGDEQQAVRVVETFEQRGRADGKRITVWGDPEHLMPGAEILQRSQPEGFRRIERRLLDGFCRIDRRSRTPHKRNSSYPISSAAAPCEETQLAGQGTAKGGGKRRKEHQLVPPRRGSDASKPKP
mmetsp:Transcript_78637/g.218347  ORF Transcript_78637/g.218347 Transcript_78637/m.218347 type:complete len:298 (-) Transcript_78637:23-916(-)